MAMSDCIYWNKVYSREKSNLEAAYETAEMWKNIQEKFVFRLLVLHKLIPRNVDRYHIWSNTQFVLL